jgi:type I restriction enzyme S subunit
MKWERIKLGDCISFISRGMSPKYLNYSEIKVLNQRAIRWGYIDEKQLKFHDSVKSVRDEIFIRANDIVLNSTGDITIGRAYFFKNAHENIFPDSHVTIIRTNSNILLPDFLYQLFPLEQTQAKIYNLVTGATGQLELSKSKICELEFDIPPLPTQRKIASTLSAYDDLIENNLKRIKLLEEKARIEYKSIQKNEKLEFKKAAEVLQFTTGKLNSNAAVENGLYPFFTCGQEILRTNTFSLDEEVVLLGGNNASAIYPVFYYKGKFDAYQRTYIIKPRPEFHISFKYVYFFWEGKLDYLKNISTGAATKFLTLKILNDIDIPLPERKVMEEYEKLAEPIFKLKAILSGQITKLREARDILLPRLMGGEIEV